MKTKISLLLLIFLVAISNAQRHYTFDYITEYKSVNLKDTLAKSWTMYILTNSKDDTYKAELTVKDSLNFWLTFIDNTSISINVVVNQKEFATAESITVNCLDINKSVHPFNDLVKHYQFTMPKDTLIKNKEYTTYRIESSNLKRKKRKKIGSYQYIVDKETAFHKPIFISPVCYESNKAYGNIPDGIFYKKIFYNYLDQPYFIWERLNYLTTNKILIVPASCR